LATINMGQKFVGAGGSVPFSGSGVPIQHKVALAEAYLHTKWHLDPCSHLTATDMAQKLRGCAPSAEGELGSHLTQCRQGRGLPACQASS